MVFFEPPSLDSRIVNQGAARISGGKRARPLCKKVVVARKLKWEVRDKLDHANIQERVLFPGLDGLSDWLKRWYTPKQAAVRPTPARRLAGRQDPT
jgi:hypothetical protein